MAEEMHITSCAAPEGWWACVIDGFRCHIRLDFGPALNEPDVDYEWVLCGVERRTTSATVLLYRSHVAEVATPRLVHADILAMRTQAREMAVIRPGLDIFATTFRSKEPR